MSTHDPRKLTTSAMIASFADDGQRTTKAPFGHALARLADERPEIVGLSADLAKYTDMHVFRDATRSGSSRWAWPSRSCSAPPPGWPRSASSRSLPPTRCSRRGAPTTSSAWISPSRA